MINKHDIIQMAKQVTKRGQNIPRRKLIHPTRDWLLGLLGFVLLTAGAAVYNANLFNRYSSLDDAVSTPASTDNPVYDGAALQQTLRAYQSRNDTFESLLPRGGAVPVAPVATSTPPLSDADDVLPPPPPGSIPPAGLPPVPPPDSTDTEDEEEAGGLEVE